MRIVINIPPGMENDEIVININKEELPFAVETTQEDIVEELSKVDEGRLNAITDYYLMNMTMPVEVEEEPVHFDEGGDIDVG